MSDHKVIDGDIETLEELKEEVKILKLKIFRLEAAQRLSTKIVHLPIEVPQKPYCWDGSSACAHFDNHGGSGVCDLDLDTLKRDEKGIFPKPHKCEMLQ